MIRRPHDDAGYFHVRALEEQAAAQRAACAEARHRHDELAAMYRFREALVRTAPPAFATTGDGGEARHRPRLVPCA